LVIRLENGHEIETQTFCRGDLQQVVGKFRDTLEAIFKIYGGSHKTPEQQLNNLRGSIEEIGVFNVYFKEILGENAYQEIQKSLFELITRTRRDNLLRWAEPVGRIIYEGNIRDFIPLDFLLLNDLEDSSKSLESLDQAMEYLTQVLGFALLSD
jgi:hypothetical protein